MNICSLAFTLCFDKKGFYNLIDPEKKLDFETRHFYWEEYVISHHQNLDSFYRILDDGTYSSKYIKRSINLYFYIETFGTSAMDVKRTAEEKKYHSSRRRE